MEYQKKIANINNSNGNISINKNNIINNTTCLSCKYNLNKNNIFDISSDDDELGVK